MPRNCLACNAEFKPRGGSQRYCCKECGVGARSGDNHHTRKAVEAGTSIRLNLEGRTFGRWTVLEFSHRNGVLMLWKCRCECGTERPVTAGSLTNGSSSSCGCFQREDLSARATSHGHSRTPIYSAWRSMVKRCHDPRSGEYPRYGARGISVCEPWRESFEAFLNDMGERPFDGASIDRIDNDGNYEPGNCRWATMMEQGQNRRNSQLVTLDGVTRTISEWTRIQGIPDSTLRYRVRRGWPIEQALTTPPDKRKPHTVPR